jgi:hypothetical protein
MILIYAEDKPIINLWNAQQASNPPPYHDLEIIFTLSDSLDGLKASLEPHGWKLVSSTGLNNKKQMVCERRESYDCCR